MSLALNSAPMVWIRRHTLALAVTLICTLLYLIQFLPVEETTIVWTSRLRSFGIVALGIWQIPFMLAIGRASIPTFLIWVLVPFYWLPLGLLTQKVFQLRQLGARLLFVFVFFIANVPAFFFATSFVDPPGATCEAQISETSLIKIVAHQEYTWLGGIYNFFLVSHDSGETWHQFAYQYIDEAYLSGGYFYPNCNNMKAFDSQFFWVWNSVEAYLSHDGGATSQTVRAWEWHDAKHDDFSIILDIEFKDSRTGSMALAGRKNNTLVLNTEDGGKTWH